MQSTPTIVAAAIRLGDLILSVPRPGRHHTVFQAACAAGLPRVHFEQGFLTSDGKFVDRIEGMKIAIAANQLLPAKDCPWRQAQLFSEDVW